MRKLIIIAVSAFVALAAVGCGSADKSASTSSPKSTWTITGVQDEYNSQLQEDIDNGKEGMEGVTDVDTTCLLSDGKEGANGTLTCHLDFDDGDSLSAQIEVDRNGMWIASKI